MPFTIANHNSLKKLNGKNNGKKLHSNAEATQRSVYFLYTESLNQPKDHAFTAANEMLKTPQL